MLIVKGGGSEVRATLAATVAAAVLAAGCSTATSGHGSGGSSHGSSSHHDFPSSLTTAAPSTPGFAPSTTSERPQTPDERAAQLRAQTGGESTVLVGVPGGFEATSYDQSGHIRFWFESTAATSWRLIGRSRYPNVAQLGPPHATAEGALLRNMTHATFIVRGYFSGDGSGNAVAFTTGPGGWGAIKAEPNGNIGPSGHPVGPNLIGLSYNFEFRRGYLVTKDCSLDRPLADCDEHPIVKLWVWTGVDFVQV
jgi:hypothetical protein